MEVALLSLLGVVLLTSSIVVCVVCSFGDVGGCINSVDMVDSWLVCFVVVMFLYALLNVEVALTVGCLCC